jgi:hypothetical protein
VKLQSGRGTTRVEVDCDFPGGNIIVDKVRGTNIRVHQDTRDTEGFWFYWCFRVRGASGRRIHVTFTGRRVFGSRGPAMSLDGSETWQWLGAGAVKRNAFVTSIPASSTDARYCFAMPYTEATLHQFLARYQGQGTIRTNNLCLTTKGRTAELILFEREGNMPRYQVLVTARHHACESMASYVVEGILDRVLGDDGDGDGRWYREQVGLMVVPFVDKDGVEDGDQGKNRRPRDHNRDYDDQATHSTVKAIKEQVPRWLVGVPAVALDLHCPYLHDEKIQIIGLPDERQWRAVGAFSSVLEGVQRGKLKFHASDNLPHGQGWNTSQNTASGLAFSSWAWRLPGMLLAATIEIPYATTSGAEVNVDTARSFGHDLARAIKAFLEGTEAMWTSHGIVR